MTEDPARARGVVMRGGGGVWNVRIESGADVDATMRGKLKSETGSGLKLTVGDSVVLERDDRDSAWAIREILPRRSSLSRRAPGGGPGERILVANLDQVVVVFAAANPEPHPRMLDRFLVIAEANNLRARIVVNKIELVGEAAARERFADYDRIGYETHYTSVKRGDGLTTLHDALAGRISVVTGPSGVGKSSLLNAMYPGSGLRVGEISQSVNKGRHTTVGARLLPLPDAGFVADTPGLREVGVWGLEAAHLDACFPEFRAHLAECRFKDCSHIAEPACAVRSALGIGNISQLRYDSYAKLREEIEAAPRY